MLIREIHKDSEACKQDILRFALVDFALKQEVSQGDAARQLLYNFLRGEGLSEAIELFKAKQSNEWTRLVELQDRAILEYDFFSPGGDKDFFVYEVIELFQEDESLQKLAVTNCQLQKVNGFFEVTGPDPDSRLQEYNGIKAKIDRHTTKHGPDPRPTIDINLFWDLIKEPELFACYIAIRSLEGNRKFTATNKPTIAGRMAGYKSAKILPHNSKIFKKFNTRYHFDRIITQLMDRSLVKSVLRKKALSKFYISTKLTPSELGTAVGHQWLKRDIKRKNDEALIALQQVYNGASV